MENQVVDNQQKVLTIDSIYEMTSRMRCLDSSTVILDKHEKDEIEKKLNSMFGQWLEAD